MNCFSACCNETLFFFLVDRRNGKAIINLHTQVEVSGFEPRSGLTILAFRQLSPDFWINEKYTNFCFIL